MKITDIVENVVIESIKRDVYRTCMRYKYAITGEVGYSGAAVSGEKLF